VDAHFHIVINYSAMTEPNE